MQLEDGLILPLNRRYKPLGNRNNGFLGYEYYLHLALPPAQVNLEAIPYAHQTFYHDGCHPTSNKTNFEQYLNNLRAVFGGIIIMTEARM